MILSAAVSLAASGAAQTDAPPPQTQIHAEYLGRLHAPLAVPQPVGADLLVFHAREGGTFTGRIRAKVVAPTGDWVRIQPDGNMRIDVRLNAILDDGEALYVTYGGVLAKPDDESWKRFLSGEEIKAPQWYYVVAPQFETASKKYAWLNGVQAIGKFVSIQTGADAHVTFDLYAIR